MCIRSSFCVIFFVGFMSFTERYGSNSTLVRASVFVVISRVCFDGIGQVLCRKLCNPEETRLALDLETL